MQFLRLLITDFYFGKSELSLINIFRKIGDCEKTGIFFSLETHEKKETICSSFNFTVI